MKPGIPLSTYIDTNTTVSIDTTSKKFTIVKKKL